MLFCYRLSHGTTTLTDPHPHVMSVGARNTLYCQPDTDGGRIHEQSSQHGVLSALCRQIFLLTVHVTQQSLLSQLGILKFGLDVQNRTGLPVVPKCNNQASRKKHVPLTGEISGIRTNNLHLPSKCPSCLRCVVYDLVEGAITCMVVCSLLGL